MKYPRIKICCISSPDEARLAIEHGADIIGMVGPMPNGPGVIDLKSMSSIRAVIPADLDTFLLTSKLNAGDIAKEYRFAGTTAVQLTDYIEHQEYAALRQHLPGVRLVQVIHVVDENDFERAVAASEHADALLLDSGTPLANERTLGGTGRVHNWDISREIVASVDVPVFLAGGLHADNVRSAIEKVKPFGVDVCSGVRTGGKLDARKLQNFIKAVRR
jgi:phosphoribosylanthranilate isomerase